MTHIWIALAALVVVVGLGRRAHLRAVRGRGPAVDDAAVRRILEEGQLPHDPDDEPLDLEEAARAEEEFWAEDWEEPDEFGR